MGRYNNFLQKGVYCKHLVSSSVDVDILGQIELLNIKSNIDNIEKRCSFWVKMSQNLILLVRGLKTLTSQVIVLIVMAIIVRYVKKTSSTLLRYCALNSAVFVIERREHQ